MPAKGDGAARRRADRRGRRFHRVDPGEVTAAALELVRRARGPVASQRELLHAVRRRLRSEDPLAALGAPRLRRILLATPGIRVEVEYAERAPSAPPAACPVCGASVVPIRNRTLDTAPVVLGVRCPTCGYWTHRRRRVPVRYSFRSSGERAGERRGPTGRPSA